MQVKIASKPAARAADAMALHANALYATPGKRVVAIIELVHAEKTVPAPDEDKDPTVTLRIDHLEIASADHEPPIRDAMRALYLGRTAQGTLDDSGEIELSERTLDMIGDRVADLESARMRVACQHWAAYCRRVMAIQKLTNAEARHELENVAAGLLAAIGVLPE